MFEDYTHYDGLGLAELIKKHQRTLPNPLPDYTTQRIQ